ncbi:hypothetical protein COFA105466_00185 [Corynebacterium falsenii]
MPFRLRPNLVAFYNHGIIMDRFHTVLRPQANVGYFNPVNAWGHGITAEDVTHAPEWSGIR